VEFLPRFCKLEDTEETEGPECRYRPSCTPIWRVRKGDINDGKHHYDSIEYVEPVFYVGREAKPDQFHHHFEEENGKEDEIQYVLDSLGSVLLGVLVKGKDNRVANNAESNEEGEEGVGAEEETNAKEDTPVRSIHLFAESKVANVLLELLFLHEFLNDRDGSASCLVLGCQRRSWFLIIPLLFLIRFLVHLEGDCIGQGKPFYHFCFLFS